MSFDKSALALMFAVTKPIPTPIAMTMTKIISPMKIFRNVEDFFFGGGGESWKSSRTCGVLFIKSLPNAAYITTKQFAASIKPVIKFADAGAIVNFDSACSLRLNFFDLLFFACLDCQAKCNIVEKYTSCGVL